MRQDNRIPKRCHSKNTLSVVCQKPEALNKIVFNNLVIHCENVFLLRYFLIDLLKR